MQIRDLFNICIIMILPQMIYTIVIWATLYAGKPMMTVIQLVMLLILCLPAFIFAGWGRTENSSFSKMLPLACQVMIIQSSIPLAVSCFSLWKKGFYDCIGEWFAVVFGIIFLVPWSYLYKKALKNMEQYPVNDYPKI